MAWFPSICSLSTRIREKLQWWWRRVRSEDEWIEYDGPIPIRVRRLHGGAGYAFDYRSIYQIMNNPELYLKAAQGIRIDPDLIDWGDGRTKMTVKEGHQRALQQTNTTTRETKVIRIRGN